MLTKTIRRLHDVGAVNLAPGLIDAGLGSLAGLVGSLYAARFFDIGQLGLFSLFFVAFQLLGALPARLVLVPAQVVSLDFEDRDRTSILARSLPTGLAVGLVSIPFVWLVVLAAPGGSAADYVAFGITTSMMVLVSPLQDHARFMLHMSGRSPWAAAVSGVQLLVALAGLLSLHLLDVPVRWIPFLSLSVANAASLTFAVAVTRPRLPAERWPGVRVLLQSGRLLLPAELLPSVGILGAAVLVARLASTDALGSAEAARVVASPILVAGTGLGQVLWPRIMGAARTSEINELGRTSRLLGAAVVGLALLYIAGFGWSHPLNIMEMLIPLAFTVTGLVAFRVVAAVGTILANIPASALMGREENAALLLGAGFSLVVQLLVAGALAPSLGAHAVPAAQLAGAIAAAAVMIARSPILQQSLRLR